MGFHTVALPSIATGGGGFSPQIASQCFALAISQYIDQCLDTTIKLIRIVNIDNEISWNMQNAFLQQQ